MKKIVQQIPEYIYDLHDSTINKFHISDDTFTLEFENRENPDIHYFNGDTGSIVFMDVDWDSSNILILNYQDTHTGNTGPFVGKNIDIRKFVSELEQDLVKFNISQELSGYNSTLLIGTWMRGPEWLEFYLSIYHFGDMVYLLHE